MLNDFVTVRNVLNGQVAKVSRKLLSNPNLVNVYEVVADGAKPKLFVNPDKPVKAPTVVPGKNSKKKEG